MAALPVFCLPQHSTTELVYRDGTDAAAHVFSSLTSGADFTASGTRRYAELQELPEPPVVIDVAEPVDPADRRGAAGRVRARCQAQNTENLRASEQVAFLQLSGACDRHF